jgi:hypothetical protein
MGATSISPGSSEYEAILREYCSQVPPDEQRLRTESFTVRLIMILATHGVQDIFRLVLVKGHGGREQLCLTLVFSGGRMFSYTVIFPIGAEPFGDPGWVAADLIRQSADTRNSLLP